jgi:hypothetical protein
VPAPRSRQAWLSLGAQLSVGSRELLVRDQGVNLLGWDKLLLDSDWRKGGHALGRCRCAYPCAGRLHQAGSADGGASDRRTPHDLRPGNGCADHCGPGYRAAHDHPTDHSTTAAQAG